jgi:sugar/nucleoside kinase (ribokinase family)
VPPAGNWDNTQESDDRLDVVCLGNALVDVLAHVTDGDLERLALQKGSMALVDLATAADIYASMTNAIEVSGGSAANTAAGVAALGGTAGYIGKIADDALGRVFIHDMSVLGVEFGAAAKAPSGDTKATGSSMVLVTDDGERTMATHLGVASTLAPEDLDQELVARGEVVYVEGYLWDTPAAIEGIRLAMEIAHSGDGLVAMTLSDSFCVERHRQDFLSLLNGDVDLLFCNEDEASLLFGSKDIDHAVGSIEELGILAAVTRGSKGSVVIRADGPVEIAALPVERVVDTTGAGDLFAAGFIYGLSHGQDPASCAQLGGACAAEVISHLGARPQADLKEIANAPRLRLL